MIMKHTPRLHWDFPGAIRDQLKATKEKYIALISVPRVQVPLQE